MIVRDLVPCDFGRGRDLLPQTAGCFQDGGRQGVAIAWRNEGRGRLWLKTSFVKPRGDNVQTIQPPLHPMLGCMGKTALIRGIAGQDGSCLAELLLQSVEGRANRA